MSIERILKLHPCFLFPEEYQIICHPLRLLGITYFGHAIIQQDGAILYSNNPAYLECYTKNQFFNLDLHIDNHLSKLRSIHWDFLPSTKETKAYHEANANFKLHHLMTLVKKRNGQTHLYHFASDILNPEMNVRYIEHDDLLEKFIHYYTDELQKKTCFQQSSELIYPVKKVEIHPQLSMLHQIQKYSDMSREKFLTTLGQKKLGLQKKVFKRGLSLTMREKQCLALLARGYTAKSIAAELNLTQRTVYFYLENTKCKLGCYNRLELVQHYWN